MKENVKLGIAIVTAGLIGGVGWKYRKKIMKVVGEFCGAVLKGYTEYELEDPYYYTRVEGHWRLDQHGNFTYVRPHYRKTWKRRY